MKQSFSKIKKPSKNNVLAIDFSRENEVLHILPSAPLLSSQHAQWKNIHLGYYQHSPYELPEIVSKQHLILIHLETPTQVEQRLGTQFRKYHFQIGNILIVPAHTPHYAYWDTEHRYLILSFNPSAFLHTVQMTGNWDKAELVPYVANNDPLVYGIGLALKAELESDSSCGSLYVDSLTTTLFTHLLHHYTSDRKLSSSQIGGLSTYRLRQIIEYINTYLDRDLALVELANVAHVSPNYFIQLFKQSTGLTPHQYVIKRRVERAKELLLEGKLAIADIALQVGFAHQSHLNRHFKRWVGVTPKVFLKNQ